VGALKASSKYLVRRLLGKLPPACRYLVEYGAGDGAVTKELLKILPRGGRLVAIEINPEFVSELSQIKDKRLKVIKGDALQISGRLDTLGLPRIEAVISGIPLSLLKPADRRKIIENTYRALVPGGMFLVYQYSPLVLPLLKKRFAAVNSDFEPRNFLPYFIFQAIK
jgi:phospholipid N-methyltransferase